MIISYAQNFEDVVLWRALKHVENGFYIDVGANDPVIDSVTQLFYEHAWCGINIEPVARHWNDLQNTRLRDINLQCAVGNFEGEIKLWECAVRGWASADEQVIAGHIANGHSGQYISIPQTTLNQVWLQHVTSEVHFLKIDVEGFERSVLEGLDFQRFRPWIVVVEATHPNTTHEIYAQWEPLLLDNDYIFVYADGLNRFYIAGEHRCLAVAFKYPPNFFDHFVKAPQMEGNLWAQIISTRADQALELVAAANVRTDQAEARTTAALTHLAKAETRIDYLLKLVADAGVRADQAETRTEEAEASTRAALAHLAVAEVRIDSLLKSTSWRLTFPVRIVGDCLKKIKHRLFYKKLANQIANTIYFVASQLYALKKIQTLFLSLYNGLRKKWTRFVHLLESKKGQASGKRLRLAFVSPMPPACCGIADYSVELLSTLKKFYDIDVILQQSTQTQRWIESQYSLRDSNWLLQNSTDYDRVLYHFGNSSHHQHMLHLLSRVPGIVVLHDFYLGDLFNYLEAYEVDLFACQRGLYKSHGYGVLAQRSVPSQRSKVTEQYPANFEVLQLALGVIVHSQHSKQLAAKWYGADVVKNWSVIPLLRQPNKNIDRQIARQALGLQPGEIMVCSFGMMSSSKLNHRLLQSWLKTAMTRDTICRLVFVGEEHTGEYGVQLRQAIQTSGLEHCIEITGWTDPVTYSQYLIAADLAVQLRSNSRGETSAAVLDCMNYGLPTIVNAHGAMAELPSTAVWMLDENFHNESLTQAIDILFQEAQRRHALGDLGQKYLRSQHAPDDCADQYRIAIERDYAAVIQATTSAKGGEPTKEQFIPMVQALARKTKPILAGRQLLVDISATYRDDLKTGIQRVVRALVWSLIQAPPVGYRIEPVYLSCNDGLWQYCYARNWTSKALGIADGWMSDDPVNYVDGDILLIADLATGLVVKASQAGVFSTLKERGVSIHFFVYDLLPLQLPHHFPPGQFGFSEWLISLTAEADSALCISRSVAEDLQKWVDSYGPKRNQRLGINWFHLGADLVNSIPSTGFSPNSDSILAALQTATSFLMVGTIEPRKGYLQTLQAFSQMWRAGLNINLVIVGREGWLGFENDQRQTIPQIVTTIQTHPELGKRLFWLDDASDEFLSKLYDKSDCLIVASEGEGFGLPLIEAARHALPLIVRDIPVFREVSGDDAFYFSGLHADDLSCAIKNWLALKSENKHPSSLLMPSLTWEQSIKRILEILQFESNNTELSTEFSLPLTN